MFVGNWNKGGGLLVGWAFSIIIPCERKEDRKRSRPEMMTGLGKVAAAFDAAGDAIGRRLGVEPSDDVCSHAVVLVDDVRLNTRTMDSTHAAGSGGLHGAAAAASMYPVTRVIT